MFGLFRKDRNKKGQFVKGHRHFPHKKKTNKDFETVVKVLTIIQKKGK